MIIVCIFQYSQNDKMKKELFATFNKTLVEASPRDRLWGIGLGQDNKKVHDKKLWRGKNLLGYALTEVRDTLLKKNGYIDDDKNIIKTIEKFSVQTDNDDAGAAEVETSDGSKKAKIDKVGATEMSSEKTNDADEEKKETQESPNKPTKHSHKRLKKSKKESSK